MKGNLLYFKKHTLTVFFLLLMIGNSIIVPLDSKFIFFSIAAVFIIFFLSSNFKVRLKKPHPVILFASIYVLLFSIYFSSYELILIILAITSFQKFHIKRIDGSKRIRNQAKYA